MASEKKLATKLTPRQREIVTKLVLAKFRLMTGQTGGSFTLRTQSMSWGVFLCRPGFETGEHIREDMITKLLRAGLIEHIPTENAPKPDSLNEFIRWQNTPKEIYRATKHAADLLNGVKIEEPAVEKKKPKTVLRKS
jgi:hypothetical protein